MYIYICTYINVFCYKLQIIFHYFIIETLIIEELSPLVALLVSGCGHLYFMYCRLITTD